MGEASDATGEGVGEGEPPQEPRKSPKTAGHGGHPAARTPSRIRRPRAAVAAPAFRVGRRAAQRCRRCNCLPLCYRRTRHRNRASSTPNPALASPCRILRSRRSPCRSSWLRPWLSPAELLREDYRRSRCRVRPAAQRPKPAAGQAGSASRGGQQRRHSASVIPRRLRRFLEERRDIAGGGVGGTWACRAC